MGGAEVVDRRPLAWQVLATVMDPEIPVISLIDLGIVREVNQRNGQLEVVLTPTYSGCPATEVITRQVREAFAAADLGEVQVVQRRAPAWTTDWISLAGRRQLNDYGIAPPGPVAADASGQGLPMRFQSRARLACPRCASADTERLSAFGSTACKALYRCRACREPFEHFKPI
jgi:ring-1,2-phenylacetyl-CoA epoxidase subunit PaaD